MDFFDLIKDRRSIRKYLDKPVEEDKLSKILESVDLAPSAGNLQGYDVVVVKDKSSRQALSKAAFNQDVLVKAPVVLVFCANNSISADKYKKRGEELYSVQDATIACAFAHLAVSALGLSSVWVGAFDEDKVKKIIQAPKGVRPVAMLPIAYPNEKPNARSRRKLDDLIIQEHY